MNFKVHFKKSKIGGTIKEKLDVECSPIKGLVSLTFYVKRLVNITFKAILAVHLVFNIHAKYRFVFGH